MRRTLCLAFVLVAAACGGGSAAQPTPSARVAERDVSFDTSDGKTLTGRLFGTGPVGVTLAHMFPADASSWYETGQKLAEAGYTALAFNFRGYESSEGPKDASLAATDMQAAANFLGHQRGVTRLAYVGASMGGTASLAYGAADEPAALVAVSAPTRFMGLDALTAAPRITAPVLLMAAQGDGPAFESLQELARDIKGARTRLFDGEAHGTNLLTDRPEAVGEILSFLSEHTSPGASP